MPENPYPANTPEHLLHAALAAAQESQQRYAQEADAAARAMRGAKETAERYRTALEILDGKGRKVVAGKLDEAGDVHKG